MAHDGRRERSACCWVAAATLLLGSILSFAGDEDWIIALRISCLLISVIAFTLAARRLNAERQRAGAAPPRTRKHPAGEPGDGHTHD